MNEISSVLAPSRWMDVVPRVVTRANFGTVWLTGSRSAGSGPKGRLIFEPIFLEILLDSERNQSRIQQLIQIYHNCIVICGRQCTQSPAAWSPGCNARLFVLSTDSEVNRMDISVSVL